MIMIDPLSELCGLCVELLSTILEPARPQGALLATLVWMGEQRASCHICLLPNFTPQPASREARHISEHKRSVSVTLEIKGRSPWSARTNIKTEGD